MQYVHGEKRCGDGGGCLDDNAEPQHPGSIAR